VDRQVAGRAIPSSAPLQRINLQGLGLGDPGVADPAAQLPVYAEELYNMGLVTPSQREVVHSIMHKSVQLTESGEFAKAFALWDSVWGDVGDEPYPSLFTNFTFSTNTLNSALSAPPPDCDYYVGWLNTPSIRRAIHVGSLPFGLNASRVYNILAYDAGEFMGETLTESMVQLLREYRVLVYSGNLDPLLGVALTEAWISKILHLSGSHTAQDFASTPKLAWRIGANGGAQLAGYARDLGNLTLLTVRNSGHLVPHDQPAAAFDIMLHMIHGQSFRGDQFSANSDLIESPQVQVTLAPMVKVLGAVAAGFFLVGMGMIGRLWVQKRPRMHGMPLLYEGV
jgi:vitellogenic carboxypeptidase-like protein